MRNFIQFDGDRFSLVQAEHVKYLDFFIKEVTSINHDKNIKLYHIIKANRGIIHLTVNDMVFTNTPTSPSSVISLNAEHNVMISDKPVLEMLFHQRESGSSTLGRYINDIKTNMKNMFGKDNIFDLTDEEYILFGMMLEHIL